jgi:hypothetical protein
VIRLRSASLGAAGLAGVLAGLLWFSAHRDIAASPPHPRWGEIAWPFAIDEWGRGKAYRCRAADCGGDVNVYIRAKIGFCNCSTGVADDAELERLSDFHLIAGRVSAERDGRPISVGWMTGRSRSYEITGSPRGERSALSIAYNDGCDAIVASAVTDHGRPAQIEPAVLAFLNGQPMVAWAKAALGQ